MIRQTAGVLVAAVWLAAVTTTTAAFAQGEAQADPIARFLGRPVAAVEMRVEGRVDMSQAVTDLISIKPGDALTLAAIRRVTDAIHQVPRFEGVRVLVDEAPAGLTLIFDLLPRHPVDTMAFTDASDTGVPRAELDRLIREQFNGLPATVPRADIEDEVRRVLRNEGYLGASVSASVVPFHDPDRSTLFLDVRAGRRTTVAAVDLRNSSPLDAQRLAARLGVAPGMPLRLRALEVALAGVREDLRDRGFYTATAHYLQPTYSDDLTQASITVVVSAGPLVEIRVTGQLPGRQDEYIPVKRQNSIDRDVLDDAAAAIDDEWRSRGYRNSRTTYSVADADEGRRRIVAFDVNRGRRFRIVAIKFPETLRLSPEDASAMRSLRVGEPFNQNGVELDLVIVRARYQERGYHAVIIEPAYEEVPGLRPDEGGVIVLANITEGPRAVVTAIAFDLGENPTVTRAQLESLIRAKVGQPYVVGWLAVDRELIQTYYQQRGFLDRMVNVQATFNEGRTEASLVIRAREGPQIRVGEILVVGTRNISREEVLRELTLRAGDPYTEAARADSYRRLYATTSYRTVTVSVEPRLPGERTVRVVVAVEEADRTPFGIGGGLEGGTRPRAAEGGGREDRLEFAPRAFVEIGRRNLGGRNRAVNFYARVSFKPRNAPDDPARDGRGFGFPEYRVTGSYTERYAFGSSTDMLATITSEQAIRTSFNFIRRAGTFGVFRPVSPRVTVQGRYALEWTRLFDEAIRPEEQPLIDRLFPQVRLSIFSGGAIWDRRDSALNTRRGEQVDANLDVAIRQLGSEVGFAKLFSQAAIYRPLGDRPVTFAARAQFGLARGFERTVPVIDDAGLPVLDPDGNALVEVVADLPASHRFFAGGSTTVRGFQLDRLGVAEIMTADGLSNGGNALVVFNAEVRAVVATLFRRNLSIVGFVDAGNVFNRVSDLDLSRLRAAAGAGVRYDSWIGPIRLDLGFKTDRMLFANARERRWEFHLSIGEVF